MSKDEKDDGKEFTFIKEHILPKRKSRLKRVCISLGTTVVLAIVFGMVARIAFIVSEPLINRILGVDINKKQVSFNTGTEGNNGGQKDTVTSGKDLTETNPSDLEASGAPNPESDTDTKDSETEESGQTGENQEQDKESMTVNNTYYIEKKVAATLEDFTTMYSELRKIASKASSSMVTITRAQENVDLLNNPYETETEAPGLVVANNGVEFLILVSYDEVKEASYLMATFTGNVQVEAKLAEYDEGTGLAIVSVDLNELSSYIIEETTVANLGESYLLSNGTPILAMGSVNGISNSFDFGIVTNNSGVVYIADMKLDLFYTSIVTSTSGLGYIVSLDGSVVGIISKSFRQQSEEAIGTVIGISRVKKLIEKMVNGEERVYIGIVAEDMPEDALTDAGINYGVYVSEVMSKSPAYKAGIQSGDIIVSINDSPVGGVNSFVSILDNMTYKSEITVGIVRFNNGTAKNMKLTLTVGLVK